jgi:hypothetical protein
MAALILSDGPVFYEPRLRERLCRSRVFRGREEPDPVYVEGTEREVCQRVDGIRTEPVSPAVGIG